MANSSLCLTPACLAAASNMLWQMAPDWEKIDPCSNFERMVCNRYEEQNAEDQDFDTIETNQNIRVLRQILELPYSEAVAYQSVPWKNEAVFARNSIDEANFNLVRRAYQTCRETDAATAARPEPLQDLLNDLIRAWPVDTNDLLTPVGPSDRDGITKAVTFLAELGMPSLVGFRVSSDDYRDPNNVLLWIDGPNPILQALGGDEGNAVRDTLTDPARLKAYSETTNNKILEFWPLNITKSAASEIAAGVVELEAFLYDFDGVAIPQTELTKDQVKPTTLEDAASSISQFDLERVVASIAPPNYKGDSVYTELDAYWNHYPAIFKKFPKTVIQGWLAVRIINTLSPRMTVPDGGYTPAQCINIADELLRHITGRFFVGARFPEAGKKQLEEAASFIKEQAALNFKSLSWMSADLRKRLAQKAANIAVNVGYRTSNPDLRSPQSLADYYKSINITTNMFVNDVSSRRHKTRKSWEQLTQPLDRAMGDWPTVASNAQYFSPHNALHMHPSMLQLPLYHPDLPSYAVFGSVGSIIGHEIFHGFDGSRRKVDENGLDKPFWDQKSDEEWEKRAQCLVQQYNGFEFKLPGGETGTVNGSTTLDENVADNAGNKMAYNAWKAYTKKYGQPAMLPGLEKFTTDQLFFIFFGATWCNSFREGVNLARANGVHAHNSARINGTITNSRAFREAFKCKVKEPVCEIY